jgi:hypothetical protein
MRATARAVCHALAAVLARYGILQLILTDNGKVFTCRFGRGASQVNARRLELLLAGPSTAPHSDGVLVIDGRSCQRQMPKSAARGRTAREG